MIWSIFLPNVKPVYLFSMVIVTIMMVCYYPYWMEVLICSSLYMSLTVFMLLDKPVTQKLVHVIPAKKTTVRRSTDGEPTITEVEDELVPDTSDNSLSVVTSASQGIIGGVMSLLEKVAEDSSDKDRQMLNQCASLVNGVGSLLANAFEAMGQDRQLTMGEQLPAIDVD